MGVDGDVFTISPHGADRSMVGTRLSDGLRHADDAAKDGRQSIRIAL